MCECECDQIVEEINKKFPNSDWNMDESCDEWSKRKHELLYNSNIKFEEFSDECYACTCPACGKIICGWCI